MYSSNKIVGMEMQCNVFAILKAIVYQFCICAFQFNREARGRSLSEDLIVMSMLFVLLAIPANAAHAERRVALVIGNGNYLTAPLRNPINDARDMRDRLLTVGFDKADIVYRENLKTTEIGALLHEWRARLTDGPNTVALVFYAGHGLQIRDENFLPTVDAQIEWEGDVPRNSLKLAELMTLMHESQTRLNLVFLDACRNNPFARNFRWLSRDSSRGLAQEKLPIGTLIAYATRPGSVAADGADRNGVFTEQLLQNLSVPGLPVEQMLKRIIKGVRNSTGNKQDPWAEGSIDEDFYFIPPSPKSLALEFLSASKYEQQPAVHAQPGKIIKDCSICPELLVLPRGSFVMGTHPIDRVSELDEAPAHRVIIDYDLAVGKFEVTQDQWQSVMGENPSQFKNCGGSCPVEGVSWLDIQEYLRRLNNKTGQRYRLLSEAEWEYAARAGTATQFSTGQSISSQQANLNDSGYDEGVVKGVFRKTTTPVGNFEGNSFGLHDMHGNVWEWVQDIWHPSYDGAPTNGSAWERSGNDTLRMLRGGSWYNTPRNVRSADRDKADPNSRSSLIGFRVARQM